MDAGGRLSLISARNRRIELDGRLEVEARSDGAPWGWNEWDPAGVAYREIRKDVSLGRRLSAYPGPVPL